MTKFEKTQVALGEFWSIDDPSSKWPGKLGMEGFPSLHLFKLWRAKEKPSFANSPVIHGISEDGEHLTLLKVHKPIGSEKISTPFEPNTRQIHWGNNNPLPKEISNIFLEHNFTANYLIVSTRLHDDTANIRKLTFSSKTIASQFGRFFVPANAGFRVKKLEPDQDNFGMQELVADELNKLSGVKSLILRSNEPTIDGVAKSILEVNFYDPVMVGASVATLSALQSLFSLLCGVYIDVQDVNMFHCIDGSPVRSTLFFYNPKPDLKDDDHFGSAIVNFVQVPDLFQRVVSNWSAEEKGGSRRRMRYTFTQMLLDEKKITLSDLRESITLLEMAAQDEKHKPLPLEEFKKLRDELNEVVNNYIPSSDFNLDWRNLLKSRLMNINYRESKVGIIKVVERLPKSILQLADEDWVSFIGKAVSLRNDATHDLGRINEDDFKNLSTLVIKLHLLYALNDILSLNVKEAKISPSYKFVRIAEKMPKVTK